MPSGIYQIINQVNGKRYVGSAVNIRHRWAQHRSALRCGQHKNRHLQHTYDKHGGETFVFSILEYVQDASQLISREQFYFDTLSPEYNITPIAGSSLGFRHTLGTRMKLSEINKGKHLSEEHKRKIGIAQRGRRSPMRGKHHSNEAKRRISVALSGERNPNYGKHLSEEHRHKLGEAQKGRHHSRETRKKMSETHKGKILSEEHKRKLSEALRAYWRKVHAEANSP